MGMKAMPISLPYRACPGGLAGAVRKARSMLRETPCSPPAPFIPEWGLPEGEGSFESRLRDFHVKNDLRNLSAAGQSRPFAASVKR